MKHLLLLLVAVVPLAMPATIDNESRDYDRVLHGKDLSDHEHFGGGDHDADYDHEAFLGEEAEEFHHLSPEESQERLAGIVDKIDKDGDGYVTFDEMRKWIQYTQQRLIHKDVELQWGRYPSDVVGEVEADQLGWEEYRKMVYGFLDEEEEPVETEAQEAYKEEHASYKKMQDRDRRRWDLADEDGDQKLTKTEFTNFLHPTFTSHMRDIVVQETLEDIQETLEDIDKDGDNRISFEEYIGDMYHAQENNEEESDWVKSEREHFGDHDKDGYMDLEELMADLYPGGFDHLEAESKHLIFESDMDQDGQLTKEEILEKYDLFVGSHVTDLTYLPSRVAK